MVLRLLENDSLGVRRIESGLLLYWNTDLSITTIQKVLNQTQVKPLEKPRRVFHSSRYNCPTRCDRVQIDTIKIALELHQYTVLTTAYAGEYWACIRAAQPSTPSVSWSVSSMTYHSTLNACRRILAIR